MAAVMLIYQARIKTPPDQTRAIYAVCRRAGIPRHTKAPKRSFNSGEPD